MNLPMVCPPVAWNVSPHRMSATLERGPAHPAPGPGLLTQPLVASLTAVRKQQNLRTRRRGPLRAAAIQKTVASDPLFDPPYLV